MGSIETIKDFEKKLTTNIAKGEFSRDELLDWIRGYYSGDVTHLILWDFSKANLSQKVSQELQGEKIDVISWHADHAKFVSNALSPAEILKIIVDEENKSMKVIVPDEFLSVAIGDQGLNTRLASKLTNWHIDVFSEEGYGDASSESVS